MIIDFTAFGDELEKIAASAFLKRLRAGLISPEEALAASRRVKGSFGPGLVGQQNLPTEISGKNLERLINIRAKRFMKKGLSEKEALRAAQGGIGELAEIQRHGDLRSELQRAAAKKRGASEKELKKLHFRLAKEKNVLIGESRPEALKGGWRGNTPTAPREQSVPSATGEFRSWGIPKDRAEAAAKLQRSELEEAAARLGVKRDLSGGKAHSRILRGEAREKFVDPMIEAQRKASMEAAQSIPTQKPLMSSKDIEARRLAENAATPGAEMPDLRAEMERSRLRRAQAEAASTPVPPAPVGIDPAVQARAEAASQRMTQQQAELDQLRSQVAAQPKPAPVPEPTPTAPAATPAPQPAAASAGTPAPTQGGMSPAAIAGLGLGAAGVVGAGAYGLHRLRQRQAQQAQQGM